MGSVLLYHGVGTPPPSSYPRQIITPERLEQHLAWLARNGYTTCRLDDWIACVDGRARPRPRTVLITFDDGYAALAEHAFPLLLKYHFTACVFVVTERLGKTNTWDEALGFDSHPLLSREQIVWWAARGIDFGAHGRTHADLTVLPPAECEREVAGSRAELAAILGDRPLAFAYPYGSVNPAVVAAARRAFAAAFTVRRGLNSVGADPHLLRRALVDPCDSLLDLALRVRFGWSPTQLVRRLVRQGIERPATASNPGSGGGPRSAVLPKSRG
jgi:peptidoglycan/xylan/chitin deacetylase (PgdA/CDA1 family)